MRTSTDTPTIHTDLTMSDTLYIRGFNEGYVITEHLPDLAQGISKIESPSPYFEGFRDGREELVREQVRALRREFLKADPGRDLDRGREADKERGFDVER